MSEPRVVATVEARMGSSRLPGKVLLPAAGRPIVQHLLDRLATVPSLDAVVLATTTEERDDALEELAESCGVPCFRGSEDDVMGRVLGAAEWARADVVVEVMGDSPLLDPAIVDQCVRTFLHNRCDYLSNVVVRSYPSGMGVQVYRTEVLRRSAEMTSDPRDREHVTRHIRLHPQHFAHLNVVAPEALSWPDLDLTLDEEADYLLLREIVEHFEDDPGYGCADVLRVLREHPEWRDLNRHVVRRGM